MNIVKFSPHLVATFGTLVLAAMPGMATPITGILQLGNSSVQVIGNGTTAGSCINFFNGTVADACAPAPVDNFTVGSNSTGPFTGGATGTIADIPGTTTFPVSSFVTVGGITFDLVDIRFNTGGPIGSCTAPADMSSGVSCTPAGSPFQLTNGIAGPNGVDTLGIQFTVDLIGYTGSKASGFTNYVGVFSTQSPINGNIDTVLNAINSGGSVSASYSATFAPNAQTPEPASMILLGAGLLGVGLFRKAKRSV